MSRAAVGGRGVEPFAVVPDAAHDSGPELAGSLLRSATRLHEHLRSRHWSGQYLVGPDPGIRFNSRIWRFVKSAARAVDWRDDLVYLQGQGYWVLANLELAAALPNSSDDHLYLAAAAADGIVSLQRPDGSWAYPNPEWQGRVATAEGSWAAIGLLAAYRRLGEERYIVAVAKWLEYVATEIGFQEVGGTTAVNYFAHRVGARVPNNTAFFLRLLAEHASAGGNTELEARCPALLAFMASVQLPSGEFPYEADAAPDVRQRTHFQCFQYNAFIAMDLLRYAELTDTTVGAELSLKTLRFLERGLEDDGATRFSCDEPHRKVVYHAAALAAAFRAGAEAGASWAWPLAVRAYRHVLSRQRADGSFPYSRGDYRVLRDDRSYPRYQAMILYHLLLGAKSAALQAAEDVS